MYKYKQIWWWGFAISFIGTLPVGTLNSTVAAYAVQNKYFDAIAFSVTAVFVEVGMVRVLLSALHKLPFFKVYVKWFNIVALLVLYLLAFVSIQAAIQQKSFTVGIPLVQKNAWLYGLALSIINPLHIPFWLGWTAVLQAKQILQPQNNFYNVYVVAIGIGTLTAFGIYGIIGKALVFFLQQHAYILNWLVGISLLVTALWQTYILQKQYQRILVAK